jgi:tetratricopeptide (TPR) repeat protein
MPLEPENQRLLVSAQGFLELGLPLEANEEIESMDAEVRHVPEVLAVRVGIYRKLEKWELMRVEAKKLAQCDPDEPDWTVAWAFATRRADSLDAARLILVHAVERLPSVAVFHFNLACYETQLGDLSRAKAYLQRAIELRGDYRLRALEDED